LFSSLWFHWYSSQKTHIGPYSYPITLSLSLSNAFLIYILIVVIDFVPTRQHLNGLLIVTRGITWSFLFWYIDGINFCQCCESLWIKFCQYRIDFSIYELSSGTLLLCTLNKSMWTTLFLVKFRWLIVWYNSNYYGAVCLMDMVQFLGISRIFKVLTIFSSFYLISHAIN
jgi:hypothetical protein